ncbi:MAG: hypothetical protein HOW73_43745 [Polyangiaceae bacterium]|nr:hypothetical protein [Polyangiaceae bacterium]
MRPGTRLRIVATSALFAAIGCEDPPGAEDAGPYEACSGVTLGEACLGGETECREGVVFPGYFCSQPCDADADCLQLAGHGPAVCEQFYGGRQCALSCDDDADCAVGTACIEAERFDGTTIKLCQPD